MKQGYHCQQVGHLQGTYTVQGKDGQATAVRNLL